MPTAAQKKQISKSEMEAWQTHLGLFFPSVPMLRPDQLAEPLGVDLRTIARLFEVDGRTDARRPWLMGIEFSAGTGERMARRVPRDAAILFYALSANYVPADLLQMLLDVLEQRDVRELSVIQQRCAELIRKRLT